MAARLSDECVQRTLKDIEKGPWEIDQGLVSWKTIFPWTRGGRDGFRMIQVHHLYCSLYYYYISSISDHQVLDLGGWGCLAQSISATLHSGYTLESPKL